jgi:dTDP-4-amino-4,6-dideoxygalactose transaminase
MRFPYSSPNISFTVFLKALFIPGQKSDSMIEDYFSKLSGKKYIIITNSCRTALYLAYKANGRTGEVLTSPLTCKVAIDPIVESGNLPIYADIQVSDLNINTEDIAGRITKNTIAIQAIHIGGNSCDMDKINLIAKSNNLIIIEDCAQSLGSLYKGKATGSSGDIACYSLIKNAYSIGGGILATNSQPIYNLAKLINEGFPKVSLKLILFRIVRNIIETNRNNIVGSLLYKILIKLKGEKRTYENVKSQLAKVTKIEKQIAAYQIKKYPVLHQQRKNNGITYFDLLTENEILFNKGFIKNASSYTKFFVYNPKIDSRGCLQMLHDQGIEAMHLEHSNRCEVQNRIVNYDQANIQKLDKYNKVHDCLVSLPVNENLKEKDIEFIAYSLINIVNLNNDVN